MAYEGLNPEFKITKFIHGPKNRFMIHRINNLYERALNRLTDDETTEIRTYEVEGHQGIPFKIKVFLPKKRTEKLPCILYYHGGGFYLKASPSHMKLLKRYASECGVALAMVDYKVSLDYPYPGGFDDAYAALEWLLRGDAIEWLDDASIAVAGDSAGGALASLVAQKARDKGLYDLTFQMLLYPVTDHKRRSETLKLYHDAPVWNKANNDFMWEHYLRDDAIEPLYQSPLACADYKGLPPTYMEVAEFDCLSGEGKAYASQLKESGSDVELHEVLGGVHGFDVIPNKTLTEHYMKKRCDFIKRSFDMPTLK